MRWKDGAGRAFITHVLASVIERWQHSIQSGEPFEMTFPLRGADGQYRPFYTLVAPLRDSSGAVQSWFGTNTDVSALKEAEDDLRAVASELSEMDRRKGEFLATLAHELRNPLAPLRNGLQSLRISGGDQAVAGRARDMMDRQLTNLVRLVDDLLDVARISGGKIELRREPVSLQTVVARAIETTMPVIEAHRHTLTVNAPTEPIVVDVDTARFSQVLSNLIGNAAKYTPPGGKLVVVAAVDSGEAVASIIDNGVGIPPSELNTVFDMFAQVRDNLPMAQGGLGIGLSLSKKLVDLHGGNLSAHSDGVGLGSTFTVRLPLADAAATPSVHQHEGPAPTVAKRSLRILVVDDNLDAGDSLVLRLTLEGYQTRIARNGIDGLRAAHEFRPHVAFLDIGMPGMNGYELAESIKASGKCDKAVLVALTGWGADRDVKRSMAAGFYQHLTKPATPADLDAVLATAIGQLDQGDRSPSKRP